MKMYRPCGCLPIPLEWPTPDEPVSRRLPGGRLRSSAEYGDDRLPHNLTLLRAPAFAGFAWTRRSGRHCVDGRWKPGTTDARWPEKARLNQTPVRGAILL